MNRKFQGPDPAGQVEQCGIAGQYGDQGKYEKFKCTGEKERPYKVAARTRPSQQKHGGAALNLFAQAAGA